MCILKDVFHILSRTGLPLLSKSNLAQVIMTKPLRSELLNRKIDVAFTLNCIFSYKNICRLLKADHTLPYSRKSIALLFFSSVSVPWGTISNRWDGKFLNFIFWKVFFFFNENQQFQMLRVARCQDKLQLARKTPFPFPFKRLPCRLQLGFSQDSTHSSLILLGRYCYSFPEPTWASLHLLTSYASVPKMAAVRLQNFCNWTGEARLFTVLYFSLRSSRSSALRYGLPSCMSVKTT